MTTDVTVVKPNLISLVIALWWVGLRQLLDDYAHRAIWSMAGTVVYDFY
tara:strand:- start:67 stop:213 length:147 start_codon:yes stop_codon:yes gene_type:complete